MNTATRYAELAGHLFDTIRAASASRVGVTRASYGEGESRAIAVLSEFARGEGLDVAIDRAGNVMYALPDTPAGPYVLCGSHMDSVPEGGHFDGLAGVVAGLLCLVRQRDEGRRGVHALRVVALRGEESAWFGKAYIGSSALLGCLPALTLKARQRCTGETLATSMRRVGADVDAIAAGERLLDTDQVAGYIELHIEQSTVLDEAQQAVAIVPSIRGNVRCRNVRCIGEDGHSGAVPRALRHDAVFAAAQVVSTLDEYWHAACERGEDLVITFGVFGTRAESHAISRIPGEVSFSFEARSADQAVLDEAFAAFHAAMERAGSRHGVRFEADAAVQTAAASMDAAWVAVLEQAACRLGLSARHLPSGAGHDAATFAAAGIRSGMIFVRNQNGSHNPDEAMHLADFMTGFGLLYEGVNTFA